MAYVLSSKGERALTRLVQSSAASNSSGVAYPASPVSPDAFAHPFKVRWSQSQNDGQGCWIIWLPVHGLNAGDYLLMVGSEYVDILEGTGLLSPATGYPEGWFKLANEATGGTVYLTVLRPLSGAASSRIIASIVTAPVTGGGGLEEGYYHRYNILIASLSTNTETASKSVKQFVESAITIPDFGSRHPDGTDEDEDDESIPKPFDIEGGKVVRCYAPAPCGSFVVGADYTINNALGDIYVHLDKATSAGVETWSLSVDQVSRAESPIHHEWTLYLYDGQVTCDCRPKVLPIVDWDNKSIDQDTNNHKVQIKGWDTATPAATNSLATELTNSGSTAKVVTRKSDGTLEYMEIGQLQGGGGTLPTNTVDVVTGIEYGSYDDGTGYDYRFRITTKPLGITNGQFSLGAATYSYINTVPLSAEWVSP